MKKVRLYPEPPHLDASFCFLGDSARTNFALVCDTVLRCGASVTGEFEVLCGAEAPMFEILHDLVVEPADVDPSDNEKLSILQALLAGPDSNTWVLRAGFVHPVLGQLTVQYGLVMRPATPDGHPICVTVSAAAADPEGNDASPDEIARAIHGAVTIRDLFKNICHKRSILYAGISVERPLPAPWELMAEGQRLEPELFVSERLLREGETERELSLLFNRCYKEKWERGVFWSAWAPFNPLHVTVAVSEDVTAQAARLICAAARQASRA